MKKQRKGFTLVELVIVIAILGILAAYAVPKYQGLVEQARSAEARAQLGTFRSALGIYYAKNHGVYPTANEVQDSTTKASQIFAEGVVPTVEVTKTDGTSVTVISSNTVKTVTHVPVVVSDIDDAGGWVYGLSTDRTQCDVRINSKGTDTSVTPAIAWNTY
jgi:prepilin-type N-terminal cleavage/methylation domain-containing protein